MCRWLLRLAFSFVFHAGVDMHPDFFCLVFVTVKLCDSDYNYCLASGVNRSLSVSSELLVIILNVS
jgi:hypothetical protein